MPPFVRCRQGTQGADTQERYQGPVFSSARAPPQCCTVLCSLMEESFYLHSVQDRCEFSFPAMQLPHPSCASHAELNYTHRVKTPLSECGPFHTWRPPHRSCRSTALRPRESRFSPILGTTLHLRLLYWQCPRSLSLLPRVAA